MRSGLDNAFLTGIGGDNVKVAEAFLFTLTTGVQYGCTNHDEDIHWGSPSILYRSLPVQRSNISSGINLEADTVEITLTNISSDLLDLLQNNVLDDVTVVIKRLLWDTDYAAGMEIPIFSGRGSPVYNSDTVTLKCASIITCLNIMVPRNCYQEPCNWALFSEGCGLIKALYKESSIATATSANAYAVIDNTFTQPSEAKKYYLGELVMTSGNNLGQRRTILSTQTGQIVVSVPFTHNVESGDTYDYYPGCSKSPQVCNARFNNLSNFFGFVYMPNPEALLF